MQSNVGESQYFRNLNHDEFGVFLGVWILLPKTTVPYLHLFTLKLSYWILFCCVNPYIARCFIARTTTSPWLTLDRFCLAHITLKRSKSVMFLRVSWSDYGKRSSSMMNWVGQLFESLNACQIAFKNTLYI